MSEIENGIQRILNQLQASSLSKGETNFLRIGYTTAFSEQERNHTTEKTTLEQTVRELREEREEAEKALDGRLGHDAEFNQIALACEEYRRAEDCLPDFFDSEDYSLSKAVEALVVAWQERNNLVKAFARAILHGDDIHKDWLLEASECFVGGKELPQARAGKPISSLGDDDLRRQLAEAQQQRDAAVAACKDAVGTLAHFSGRGDLTTRQQKGLRKVRAVINAARAQAKEGKV